MIKGLCLCYASHLFLRIPSERAARSSKYDTFNLIILIALILTFILISFQKYVIKITNSLSIKADRTHYTGDILMNIGVILSLICSYFIKTGWLDALFGVGVGLYLIKVSYQIIHQAIGMLMDTEMPKEVRHQIKETVLTIKEIHQISDLRTRQSGNIFFIQMTLHMTASLSLKQAHQLADQVEFKIHQKYPDSEIILHLEPYSK